MTERDGGEVVSIGIPELALFLHKSGWKRVPHPNERLLVFEGPVDDFRKPLKIVLPASDDYVDSTRMIDQALSLVADLKETSTVEVIRSIRSLDRDVLTIRLLGAQRLQDGLPLDVASSFVLTIRDLLSYAACVEDNPRPYFYKASAIGRRYAERCLFGHTFTGSFGFTIESPTGISPYDKPADASNSAPFERRVLVRVVRGLQQVKEAVLSGQPNLLVERYKSGFNANLCELLAESFKEIGDTELEYSVGWSPEWPVPQGLGTGPIRLESKASQFLDAAAKELRKLRESQLITVTGKVVALRWEAPSNDDEETEETPQTATILWEEEKGKRLRVQVELENEDYLKACDAHKTGLSVSVTGTLEKVGKFWKLMAPSGFQTSN
jgi:hypothetical protein